MLEGSSIVAVVSQFVAGGVPERVRMNWERELCGFSSPGDCFQETCRRGGTTALGNKNVSRFHILAA